MENYKNAKHILYIWGIDQTSDLENNVKNLKLRTNAEIKIENIDRLSLGT